MIRSKDKTNIAKQIRTLLLIDDKRISKADGQERCLDASLLKVVGRRKCRRKKVAPEFTIERDERLTMLVTFVLG